MTSRSARSTMPIEAPTVHGFRDLRRDWRRWSPTERVSAAALSAFWVLGVAVAIAADAHLL